MATGTNRTKVPHVKKQEARSTSKMVAFQLLFGVTRVVADDRDSSFALELRRHPHVAYRMVHGAPLFLAAGLRLDTACLGALRVQRGLLLRERGRPVGFRMLLWFGEFRLHWIRSKGHLIILVRRCACLRLLAATGSVAAACFAAWNWRLALLAVVTADERERFELHL